MTVWNKIYQNYQKSGEAWATLSKKEVHPLFKRFLNRSNFVLKRALDIGCGTGMYLKYLQAKKFRAEGIDSSKIAVEMTKKALGDNSKIICADMFRFEIPRGRYDLIFSTFTIHHGTKKQIQKLIGQINKSLTEKGKVFITLPNSKGSKVWKTFKNRPKKIAERTFVPTSGPEKGLAHSFYTRKEVKKLFSKFKNLQVKLDHHGEWIIQATK